MLLTIVFSHNRAMQLDATLRSFFLRCVDASATEILVLFKASGTEHEAQYQQLQTEYAGRVRFILETDFRQQLLQELIRVVPSKPWQYFYSFITRFGYYFGRALSYLPLKAKRHNHVLFLVDDNIFVRDFSVGDIVSAMEKYPDALGLSLRLGENTTYCYALDKPQQPPAFQHVMKDIFIYSWPTADADFGYPIELSSSAYRVSEMLSLFASVPFRNPNTLESAVAGRARRFAGSHPDLLCFRQSVAFCAPINRVQDVMQNRAGQNAQLSSEKLAELFAGGKRIDVQRLFGFVPNACHQEVELFFEQDS